MSIIRNIGQTGAVAGAMGAGVLAYAHHEARRYTLRQARVPVLPAGADPVRVLHVSDIHMMPGQRRKQDWLRRLAQTEPDLVINTGDNLSHPDAVAVVLESLGPLRDLPGAFVFGSNDYFAPILKNPLRYLLPDDGRRATHQEQLPWRELRDALCADGWTYLGNRRDTLEVHGLRFAFAGVDDPHLSYDDLDAVAGPADPEADVRLGVTHAPYLRVLDRFAADGYDAIVAGHTHGGQVCLPWPGGGRALTTNCDLDPARVKGLHRHPADSVPGDPGSSWLHVSAGLGTNPYTRVRLACRPEATLLTLTERPSDGPPAR